MLGVKVFLVILNTQQCLLPFADTDLLICIVYSVSNGMVITTGYKPFSGLFIYLSVCLSIFALDGQYLFCYMNVFID